MSAQYRCKEMTRSHSILINICSFPQEMKRSSRYDLYVSTVSSIDSTSAYFNVYMEKSRKVESQEREMDGQSFLHKYYLRRWVKDFFLGQNSFWFIVVIKKIV